jgi:phospholipase/carboxylesterase
MRGERNNQRQLSPADAATIGVLRSRPRVHVQTPAPTFGTNQLGLTPERDTLLFVPAAYAPSRPAPLMVMLHGAGGVADHSIALFQRWADESAALLLAPTSQRATWDVIMRAYGADVAVLDRALAHVFGHYNVDTSRLLIGGFSDGASYALSLGVINGNLFNHIAAFSPGFIAPTQATGSPRIYISHGTNDTVLPIERCSRRIVPRLQEARYDVVYHEFDGGHTILPDVIMEARTWFGAH